MRLCLFSSRTPRWNAAWIGLFALCGAALLSGCGGDSSSPSNAIRVRAINAVSNGGSATVSINGNAVGGTQNYFGVSSYQSQNAGSDSATVSLTANSGATYPAVAETFTAGNYYSLFLVGRADITASNDPRYPTLIAASDLLTTPSTNQATVRVIDAAPDAGNVDVLVNNAAALSGGAYKSISGYVNEPTGNVTIQVNQAGTSTVLVSPQTVSLTAGHAYTVYVVEPTVSTGSTAAVYALQESDDTSSAVSSG